SLILQFGPIQPSMGIAPNISVDNAGNAVVAYETVWSGGSGRFVSNAYDIAVTKVSSAGVTDPDALPSNTIAITYTGIAVNAPGINSTLPDIALDPSGTGMFVVAFNTQLLGAPVGYRTVQVDEVNGNNGSIMYWYNEPAFPNNVGPAVSLDANGGYQ